MAYTFHHLPTSIRVLRTEEGCNQGDHSPRDSHVSKCHSAQSVTGLLDSHFLPSCTNPPYTHGCPDELRSL